MQPFPREVAAHSMAWPQLLGHRDELQRLLRVLRNRRWLILAITLLLTLGALVLVYQLTPRYTATAKLLLEASPSGMKVADTPMLPGLMVDRERIESEMQVLSSRKLAGAAVDKLGLVRDPEFNEDLRPPSSLGFVTAALDRVREVLRTVLGRGDADAAALDPEARTKIEVVDALLKKTSVQREGQSRVISVSAESEDPLKAALIANTLADLYFDEHIENQFAKRKRIAEWLDERLGEFKVAAAASQKAVEDYRREARLFSTRDEFGRTERIDTQQLTQISAELITARSDRTALEARLRTVERLDRNSQGYESVPEVINNPVIGSLRSQEAKALQRIADLGTEYGPRHPTIVAAKSELEDIRTNIRREVSRVVASVRNEVARARAREAALQEAYRELEARTAEQNSREIKLSQLSREADVNRRILEQFLEQFKELSARQALAEPEARVVANAEPPALPSFPRKGMMVGLAFLGSLLLSCALALLLERFHATFRTSEEVEEVTGLPVLSVVPRFTSGIFAGRGDLTRESMGAANAKVAEALHALGVGLLSRGLQAPRNRILFTSSFPNEGKSSIAVGFGRMLADQGRRVVLIDADFRRPRVSSLMGLGDAPGAADFLRQRAALDDILHKDPASEMLVLPPGRRPGLAGDLLDPDTLEDLFRRVSLRCDVVVVDSPPVLVVPDVLMLCRAVDHSVMVIRWHRTSREDVGKSLRQLRLGGVVPSGVVLNAVQMTKYAAYAYRDSKTYLRAYTRYYGK